MSEYTYIFHETGLFLSCFVQCPPGCGALTQGWNLAG